MSATQDYVALDWIRGEIAKTLEQARHALESVAEDPDDTQSMRSCLTALHQVHGTMKMVELDGPSRVADEMEQLAQALMNGSVPELGNAQEVLMQSILQMPGYLDLIQREQGDSENNYLPLVNNLRAARGEELIAASAPEDVPAIDLSPVTRSPDSGVVANYVAARGEATVPKLRQKYRIALSALLKKSKPRENLSTMGKVFSMLVKLCGDSPPGNLSQLGLALVEAVAAGVIRLDASIAGLFRSLDTELERLADGGAAALEEPIDGALVHRIFAALETASRETARMVVARGIFSTSRPDEPETVSIGPDDETLAAVARILIEELRGFTDKLDIYVRTSERDISDLVEMLPVLEQVSSTLSVVGMPQHQESVRKQIEIVKQVRDDETSFSEEVLLEMAGDLLEIESMLSAVAGESEEGAETESVGDLDEAQAAVVRETRNGLAKCRDAIIEFVSADFDHEKLQDLPNELRNLRGGLLIVQQDRAGSVLDAAAAYVETGLLRERVRPELSAMDDLADAITSIDYYLERLLENAREPYLQMIEVAEAAVGKLVAAPPPEEEAAAPEEAAVTGATEPAATGPEEALDEDAVDEDEEYDQEPQERSLAEVPAESPEEVEPVQDAEEVEAEAAADTAETREDTLIDADILEIFVEEVEEVLESLGEQFPVWRADASNQEALAEVRRAFHTLKGSGRMVGATVIGELAWAIENMLNRVIDGTVQPDDRMMRLIAGVIERIPGGLEKFRIGDQESFDVDALVAEAEAVVSGEPVEETDGLKEAPGPEEEEVEALAAPAAEVDAEAESVPEEEPETQEASAGLEPDTETVAGAGEESAAGQIPEPLDEFDELDDLEDIELDAIDVEELISGSSRPVEPDEAVGVETVSTQDLAADDELELDDIFVIEARERLDLIRAFIANPVAVTGDLVAAFHTLKGSAAMAEVASISAIAGPLEQIAGRWLTRVPDGRLIDLMRRACDLIQAVLDDLPGKRDAIEGQDELQAELAGFGESAGSVEFDFEQIRLLAEEEVVSGNWKQEYVEAVRKELEHASTQAAELRQEELLKLIRSLLRIYEQVESNPGPEIIDALRVGHDRLVSMFDHIASSQEVEDAADVIALLDTIRIPVAGEEEARVDSLEEEVPGETGGTLDDAASQAGLLPADEIDEDILPIFLEESEELLEGIDESILEWSENRESTDHLDHLLRHLHTLKGSARMAGLNSLGEYAHNFETYLIGMQTSPEVFDEAFFTLINEWQDEITRRVGIYQKLESGTATAQELESLREDRIQAAPPASGAEPDAVETGPDDIREVAELPADDIDEDVLPVFLEEVDELLESLDESIQSWSENPENMEHHENLLRHLHTIKGGARMAGMNSLGEFTHNFESFLTGIRNESRVLDQAFFSLLNERQDEIVRRVGIYRKLADGRASQEELASLTKDIQGPDGSEEQIPRLSTEEPVIQTGETSKPQPPSPGQEMVRVSADLLEELISLAGESSITRGRVEQQISDFSESLQDMEQTISRIRDQVRRLEIEAESRETLLRSQSAEDTTFDELEMDRYTMLQEISRTLNESASDLMDLKETLVNRSRDAETLLHQQSRIGSELQEGLTRTRMVPFARLIPRLRRIVRQVSAEIGKSVRFDAFNIEGELDRSVLERIVAPLEHMLRNAVDHGIESAGDRARAGKPEQGRISLRLSREGGYVILTISDDGGGINVDAVRAKAIEKGLMEEDSGLSDREVMQFIMDAGFSTAQKLTQISGRGVGLDVVSSEIKSLGGAVTIDSTLGVGTEFTIQIPFTVSINRALMVVVKEETYAVPLNTIEGIVRVSPYELEAYYQPDAPMFEYAGQPYRLDYMGKMLDRSELPNLSGLVTPLPVILARSGETAVALQVDRVIGSREVVVKTLGPQFSDVGGVAGATILGDGSVVVILDVMALVRSYDLKAMEAGSGQEAAETALPAEPEERVRTIMIVDDSVTVRKVTSRLMERQGWEVATAKDGVDAVNQLQDLYPDVVLLDIEMPRMDGFEVLRTVRHDERLKDLPIIMITSRTGEKHKQEALELGVNRYLGKPFQEASLLGTIEEVIAEANRK